MNPMNKNSNSAGWFALMREMDSAYFFFGAGLAEKYFFKNWLGISKLFSSLSPLREPIGVKS
jgi:hypothetical protein